MNKLKYLSIFSLFFSLSIPAYAQTPPKFAKRESYASVRTKMLKAGWKPYRSPNADECWEDDSRCQGRPEMETCSGSGLAPCRYLWKKQGKTIGICTIGEENNVFNGFC